MKKEPLPPERRETARRAIIALIEKTPMTARDISAAVRVSERDVYRHLEHIQRTFRSAGKTLVVTPARCRHCGFVFRKRERLTKPGRCPLCRKGPIDEPLFSVA
ncbi:MAG: transcriptional regulator [Deltaproteobacteria bacterium]|nr:transcriptional regulator [Deltaproteobacteria bacterium]